MSIVIAMLAGCAPDAGQAGRQTPPPLANADVIAVEVSPPTVQNFDDKPGPDGFDARIHFFLQSQAAPILVSGKVDMMMYEVSDQGVNDSMRQKPLHTWSLTPQMLNRFVTHSKYGWCYTIRFDWGRDLPRTEKIVIQAVYTAPDGGRIASAPIVLMMVAK